MLDKLFSRPLRFVQLSVIFAVCHFGAFAFCYFFYRRSYFVAPTAFQAFCGVVASVLAYPLRLIEWIPREPNKVLFLLGSMLNSLVYAVVLAGFIQGLRRCFRTEGRFLGW
jgi:uncharacterized membrane protein